MDDADRPATAIAFGVLFMATFLHAWFIRWITEFAMTNRRVISKRGFITRQHRRDEHGQGRSVDVDQSMLGRVLDYGTVHVIGTRWQATDPKPHSRHRAPASDRVAVGAAQRDHGEITG